MSRRPFALLLVMIVVWLLLGEAFSIGYLLLGVVVSVLLLAAVSQLRPMHPRLRNLHLLPPLLARVAIDILRSNIGVARIVLGLAPRAEVRSGFLDIPLELRDPHALAMLASIITSTPGAAWAGVSPDGATLTLHVLDLKDEAGWIRTIKERYERPLMRIFE